MRLSCGVGRPFPGNPVDIAREDPITANLHLAWATNENIGDPRDAIRGAVALRSSSSVSWVGGKDGPAIDFASSAYCTSAFNPRMNGSSGTYSCWINTTTAGVTGRFFSRDDGGGGRQVIIFINTSNRLGMYLLWGGFPTTTSSATINDGKWHHVAFTWRYDGTNTEGKLYLDGTQVGSTISATGAMPTTATDLWIGRYQVAGDAYTGKMQNLLAWDRALHPGEIRRLFLEPWCWASNDLPLWNAPAASSTVYSRYYYDLLPMHTGSPF